MYKLKKALDNNENMFYVICKNDIPDFYLSLYLKQKSINSIETAKTYGEKITFYLNFLNKKKIDYKEANIEVIKNFFLYLLNFDAKNEFSNNPKIGSSTLKVYKSSIVDFYRFFTIYSKTSITCNENKTDFFNKLQLSWKEIQDVINITLDLHIKTYKVNEKEFIKEYKDEEIQALFSQLKTLRNKSIFLLTLHGMRIDEVLSITQDSYNAYNQTVKPTRSKGKKNSKKRLIVLNDECIKVIENYILNERTPALKKVEKDSPYLFVNLKINTLDDKLEPLKYLNFYNSLNSAAKKSNILGNVRTHTGRSHRAIELLRVVKDGKLKLTDEHFRLIMGWKNMESSEPYIQHENEQQAIELSRELSKMKRLLSNE